MTYVAHAHSIKCRLGNLRVWLLTRSWVEEKLLTCMMRKVRPYEVM